MNIYVYIKCLKLSIKQSQYQNLFLSPFLIPGFYHKNFLRINGYKFAFSKEELLEIFTTLELPPNEPPKPPTPTMKEVRTPVNIPQPETKNLFTPTKPQIQETPSLNGTTHLNGTNGSKNNSMDLSLDDPISEDDNIDDILGNFYSNEKSNDTAKPSPKVNNVQITQNNDQPIMNVFENLDIISEFCKREPEEIQFEQVKIKNYIPFFNTKLYGSTNKTKPLIFKTDYKLKRKVIKKTRVKTIENQYFSLELQKYISLLNTKETKIQKDQIKILLFLMSGCWTKETHLLNMKMIENENFMNFLAYSYENMENDVFSISDENVTAKEMVDIIGCFLKIFNSSPLSVKSFSNFDLQPLDIPQVRIGYYNQWLDYRPDFLRTWEKSIMEPYSEPKDIQHLFITKKNVTNEIIVPQFIKDITSFFKVSNYGNMIPFNGNGIIWLDELSNDSFKEKDNILLIYTEKSELESVISKLKEFPILPIIQLIDFQDLNFRELSFNIFNKFRSVDSYKIKDSYYSKAYDPVFILTPSEGTLILHVAYYLTFINDFYFSIVSIIDSYGQIFQVSILKEKSKENILKQIFEYITIYKKEETYTDFYVEKYRNHFELDEIKFWKSENFKCFEIFDKVPLQLIFDFDDSLKKVNNHSIVIKSSESIYYIVTSLFNPFIQQQQWSDPKTQHSNIFKVISLEKEKEVIVKSSKQFYNLSWLTLNPSFPNRKSHLPIHLMKIQIILENLNQNGYFIDKNENK